MGRIGDECEFVPRISQCPCELHGHRVLSVWCVSAGRCSYNAVSLDGAPEVPSCAWSWANNDVVRGQWGWDGFFVSDCGAIDGIFEGCVCVFVRLCEGGVRTRWSGVWWDALVVVLVVVGGGSYGLCESLQGLLGSSTCP